jgi:hypothetical protein
MLPGRIKVAKRTTPKKARKGTGVALAGVAALTGFAATSSQPPSSGVVPTAAVEARAVAPNGEGYWLVTSAGKVYPFGSAKFYGDVSHVKLVGPVVGIVPTPDGKVTGWSPETAASLRLEALTFSAARATSI